MEISKTVKEALGTIDVESLSKNLMGNEKLQELLSLRSQVEGELRNLASMPPMPKEPERAAMIRARGEAMAQAYAQEDKDHDEEKLNNRRIEIYDSAYTVAGKERIPDKTDWIWITEYCGIFSGYEDNRERLRRDEQDLARLLPDLPLCVSSLLLMNNYRKLMQAQSTLQ